MERNILELFPPLEVVTGLPDDLRCIVTQQDAAYKLAHLAWRWQASWTPEYVGDFWQVFLHQWPRDRGRASSKDRIAACTEYAFNVLMLEPDEIAERLLGIEPASLRRHGYLERGDDIARKSATDAVHGGQKEEAIAEAPYAPFVYATHEPAPSLVRPTLTALDLRPVESVADARVVEVEQRLHELERMMWASGELVRQRGLHVRNGDVAKAFAALRRLLAQDELSPAEIDDLIADGIARGKLPPFATAA